MRQNSYSKMIIILVANKSDLNIERQVGQEEGQAFAQKHDLLYFETSAKTGQGVEAVFTESASFINENIKQGEYDLRTENIDEYTVEAINKYTQLIGENYFN